MREIKFRGQKKNIGEWVEGGIYEENETFYIRRKTDFPNNVYFSYAVETETVGQFTGLKDINGKEIYEGDVCKIYFNYCSDKIGVVYFENGCFYVDDKHPSGNLPLKSFREGENNTLEVIGNIYDNPELLQP